MVCGALCVSSTFQATNLCTVYPVPKNANRQTYPILCKDIGCTCVLYCAAIVGHKVHLLRISV